MLNLRPATIEDLDLLRQWDEEPHVVESDPNDDWGWEVELARNPDWREQLIAQIDGRLPKAGQSPTIGFIYRLNRSIEHYI